jgi:serine/threonine protein kinase
MFTQPALASAPTHDNSHAAPTSNITLKFGDIRYSFAPALRSSTEEKKNNAQRGPNGTPFMEHLQELDLEAKQINEHDLNQEEITSLIKLSKKRGKPMAMRKELPMIPVATSTLTSAATATQQPNETPNTMSLPFGDIRYSFAPALKTVPDITIGQDVLKYRFDLGNGAHSKVELYQNDHMAIARKSALTHSKRYAREYAREKSFLEFLYPGQYWLHETTVNIPCYNTQPVIGANHNGYEIFYFTSLLIPYVPGFSLNHAVKFAADEKELLAIYLAVAQELKRLHQFGVLHGDIKGDNIIVYKDPNTHKIKVTFIDFGWAYKISDLEARVTGELHQKCPHFPRERTGDAVRLLVTDEKLASIPKSTYVLGSKSLGYYDYRQRFRLLTEDKAVIEALLKEISNKKLNASIPITVPREVEILINLHTNFTPPVVAPSFNQDIYQFGFGIWLKEQHYHPHIKPTCLQEFYKIAMQDDPGTRPFMLDIFILSLQSRIRTLTEAQAQTTNSQATTSTSAASATLSTTATLTQQGFTTQLPPRPLKPLPPIPQAPSPISSRYLSTGSRISGISDISEISVSTLSPTELSPPNKIVFSAELEQKNVLPAQNQQAATQQPQSRSAPHKEIAWQAPAKTQAPRAATPFQSTQKQALSFLNAKALTRAGNFGNLQTLDNSKRIASSHNLSGCTEESKSFLIDEKSSDESPFVNVQIENGNILIDTPFHLRNLSNDEKENDPVVSDEMQRFYEKNLTLVDDFFIAHENDERQGTFRKRN